MSEDNFSRPMQLSLEAKERRKRGELSEAAVYYTTAAFGWFERMRHLPDESEKKDFRLPKFVSWGATELLAAALCFRLDGSLERAQSRCNQGVIVVTDARDHERKFTNPRNRARQGLAFEIIGDLQLFGNFDSYDDSYRNAKEIYSSVESSFGWQAEEEFESLIRPLFDLAESVEYNIDAKTQDEITRTSLVKRIEFKRDNYTHILDGILNEGGWTSDDF